MNILVFAGFLGSGKTTLILALAQRLAAAGRRTCYIVNEVGEVGIDPQVMRDEGLSVYEVTAGCICCQLTADLLTTLRKIGSLYAPDVVIVEASGIATPQGILDALSYYDGPSLAGIHTVTVVDPTRLEALLEVMTPLIEGQVRGADRIVVTKLDEATPEEVALARHTAARLRPDVPVSLVSADAGEGLALTLGSLIEAASP